MERKPAETLESYPYFILNPNGPLHHGNPFHEVTIKKRTYRPAAMVLQFIVEYKHSVSDASTFAY